MKVQEKYEVIGVPGHYIEVGTSTWDPNAKSVRCRYPTSNGGFSPRSSSELPIPDIKEIVFAAVKAKLLPKADVDQMIAVLKSYTQR